MKKNQSFINSFVYAFSGIKTLLKERNFRFHCLAFLSLIILGYLFNLTRYEWIVVLLASGFVLALEAINTSIELLCDLVSKEENRLVEKIKDVSAAAVLIQAVFSVLIALIICFRIVKQAI